MSILQFTRPRTHTNTTAQYLRQRDSARLRAYHEYWDFYDGDQTQGTKRGRSALVVNYARAIVDKHLSYLFARGLQFSVQGGSEQNAAAAELLLAELAEDAALPRVLLQAGTNAMVCGDCFLKLVYDTKAGRLRILNLDPTNVFPIHRPDDPSQLLSVQVCSVAPAAAYGRQGRDVEVIETWTEEYFTLEADGATVTQGENPYGFLPFWHIPNLAPPNTPWGQSDLADLIPLNRELNNRISDQADTIRYHADPPVIFKGVEEHSDMAVGPGTVWDLPGDGDVSLLEWTSQPPAVDNHLDRIQRAIYDVTESPRTTFGDTAQGFSGVALETQVQPIVQRTLRQRAVWDPALRDIARAMLRLADQFHLGPDGRVALSRLRPQVVWYQMLPRDDAGEANRHLALVAGGLESTTTAMTELGIINPEKELTQVIADRTLLLPVLAPNQATPAELNKPRLVPSSP